MYSFAQYATGNIETIVKDSYFQVALFLASPQLYEILAAKDFDFRSLKPRERLSVLRYYNRMSFRPTPFGSFSSFSLTAWGQQSSVCLTDRQFAKLHLHIDQETTLQLAQGLTGEEIENSAYAANPSLYKSGKDFRFIKTSYSAGNKNIFFDLESIESNALTNALFNFCAGEYKKGKDFVAYMVEITGCTRETASDYLHFLIDANIVIPQTAMNIIGEDYLERLLDHPDIPTTLFRRSLSFIAEQLKKHRFPDVGHLSAITGRVNDLLFGSYSNKEKPIFYAGLERKAIGGNLATKYQRQIMEGLSALQLLVPPGQPAMLQQFIQDFKKRYDQQKIPLLQAIDPEIGIGYGPLVALDSNADLLRHVSFSEKPGSDLTLQWSAAHRLLLKRWNGNSSDTDPIALDDMDLSGLSLHDEALASPPTLSVLFRVINEQVFLETIGGASATALIGRFTTWSQAVHRLSTDLAAREQAENPNVIFADIGQLSDAHADNINRRKNIYNYEIPVNSVATLPDGHQIALSDLWISVIDNELILESKSLSKVIIPRLASAYNYNRNNLALFRLLCDLQYQGLQGNYSLDLEQYFPGMDHYPRVVYKRTILSLAMWHLSAKDLKALKAANEKEAIRLFRSMRENLKLPAIVALRQADQQLVFNLDQESEIVFLLYCLKLLNKAVLQEFLLPAKGTVISEEQPLVNQFIAFLAKKEMVYPGFRMPEQPAGHRVRQEFILGSKWLYLKLYCNPALANGILVKKLLPLLSQFKDTELIAWFFIRYRDSGYHIRLRLKINEAALGYVLSRLKTRLADQVHYHLIREYQADTYRREMERYGPDIIELVESFFYSSSELVLRYIKAAANKSFSYSYHSLAFVSIAQILNSFIPEMNEQLVFLEQMANTFYAEFSTDKSLKIDLDQKFREVKTEISGLLTNEKYYTSLKLKRWADLYAIKINILLKATAAFSAKRKDQLLADLIHMHLNRLFIDRQRNQELIIYYCLYKYQLAIKAIKKKNG